MDIRAFFGALYPAGYSTQIMNKLRPEAICRLKKVGHLCLESGARVVASWFSPPSALDFAKPFFCWNSCRVVQSKCSLGKKSTVSELSQVSGGALRGLAFEDLTTEQLTKAAKRYSGDRKLHKYARAVLASFDLDGNEPEPCRPVLARANQSSATVPHDMWVDKFP